jgi:hypothetical protein
VCSIFREVPYSEQTLWRLEMDVAKDTDMIPPNVSLVRSLPYSAFWPYRTPTAVAALAGYRTTLATTMLHIVLGRDTVEFAHFAFPVILSVVPVQLVRSLARECCGASITRTVESVDVSSEVTRGDVHWRFVFGRRRQRISRSSTEKLWRGGLGGNLWRGSFGDRF